MMMFDVRCFRFDAMNQESRKLGTEMNLETMNPRLKKQLPVRLGLPGFRIENL